MVMVGVMAALAGFALPENAYHEAIAGNFAGKDRVVKVNAAVFELARQWALQQPG
jgi:Pyruvate/2-oxoacid:ferredoxin oxidoreductase gamma subunit